MNKRYTLLAILMIAGVINFSLQAMSTGATAPIETTFMPGANEMQDQGGNLIGTWCHSARTPFTAEGVVIGAKHWQTPNLPWVDASFLKNFGGTLRSGRPSGGYNYICQHFYVNQQQKADDGSWEIINKGNGIFTLKFNNMSPEFAAELKAGKQYVFQEAELGRRKGKVRLSGGNSFTFRAMPIHKHEEKFIMEPIEAFQTIDIEENQR